MKNLMGYCRRGAPLLDRIMSKVETNEATGCLEWMASRNPDGYGRLNVEGKLQSAHRVSYELKHGRIPDGMRVLHRCDNPPCINPDHLFLGTQAENVNDMISKGRKAIQRGEDSPGAKLTMSDVVEIRGCKSTPAKILAERYGVCEGQIYNIRKGKCWGTKDENACA